MLSSIIEFLIADKDRKYTQGDLDDFKAVGAVIKNKNNDILMQKHNKFGFWTIPCGKVDPGETLESALKKEIFEECGIIIEKFKLISEKSFKYIRKQKQINVDTYIYEIIEYTGKILNKEPEKHEIQKFMSINEILKVDDISHQTQMYLDSVGMLPKRLNNMDQVM